MQERFHKLLLAPGKEFDGQIEGPNLLETSVGFGEQGGLFPRGFTPAGYRDAVITNMIALKRTFPRSVAMQYANFMPGEGLPDTDKSYLRRVYQRAKELKVGVGGPDLLPYKPGQMNHCYPLIRDCTGKIPTGIAVQEGNYQHKNPKTGERVMIPKLVTFATDYLKVDYLFWSTQEPFYSQKLLPLLQRQRVKCSLQLEAKAKPVERILSASFSSCCPNPRRERHYRHRHVVQSPTFVGSSLALEEAAAEVQGQLLAAVREGKIQRVNAVPTVVPVAQRVYRFRARARRTVGPGIFLITVLRVHLGIVREGRREKIRAAREPEAESVVAVGWTVAVP